MPLKKLTAFSVGVFLLTGLLLAQGPRKDVGANVPLPADEPRVDTQGRANSLSIDVDLVTLDVVVTDKNGNPISGLVKEDFTLFEEGVEQTVTNFAPTDAPLTVVIVVEFGDTFGYYADDVVGPAAGFIQSLRDEDWAALVAYDIRPEILVDFTKNRQQLFDGLKRLTVPAYREVALYDTVYDTLERLEQVDGKKVMFLLSTGMDTISKRNLGETLRKAETADTMIYGVGMGQMARLVYERQIGALDQITFLQADNVIRSLSESTGGVAFFPRFPGEYPGIYETVAINLRNQYSLGFVPKNQTKDGKMRKIKIEVPKMDVNNDGKLDDLKVRHKKGYYAPKS
jgi:VWFA-related protein